MLDLWQFVTLGTAFTLAGCTSARHPAIPMVRVEAERDLVCPGKDITVHPRIGGRYKAIGCGRTATYNTACEGLSCSVSHEDDQAQPWRGRPDPGSTEAQR